MTVCAICGKDDGHHHDHDEKYVCPKCYPIIKPLIDVRMEQLNRLRLRREKATADNLRRGDW